MGGKEDSANQNTDIEGVKKNLPYPKAVFFIIVCEFCERFCYYGMRTILTLYFVQVFAWDDDLATVVYHVYILFAYMTPLVGAMLADSLLGKFRTIFYLGTVYVVGCVVLSLAATPPLNIPTLTFSMIGLALIAIGTGGIKPCVSAFGADQFKLPEQEVQVASFFAIFYFAINSGSLISTLITPILREDVKCFEDDHCYLAAFSIPAGLMVVALAIFLIGRPLYKVNKPEGNVVLEVIKAIWHALGRRGKEVKAGRTREHWIDYADDRFPKRFLEEAKVLFKVLFLYIPVPLFWALFDQQGSRWTLQATRMDGNTFGWVIKPDQMQVINPLLVLAFIPIFDQGIYPLLGKFGILKKPLQRLAVGGIFAGLAFVISGFVELGLEKTYAIELKNSESNMHMINGYPCPVTVTLNGEQGAKILPNEMHIYESINSQNYTVAITLDKTGDNNACAGYTESGPFVITAHGAEANSYIIVPDGKTKSLLITVEDPDDLEKSESGSPRIRAVYHGMETFGNVKLQGDSKSRIFDFDLEDGVHFTEFAEIESKEYTLTLSHNGKPEGMRFENSLEMKLGAVYILSVIRTETPITSGNDNQTFYQIGLHEITKPNSVHMLLLIPQYIVMTMGEIMFSITIMDFSYAEGPPSMKSVMQSAWLMTVAVGNLIVVIVAEAKIFDKQWKEFFLFAGLMFLDMALFSYMAYKYVPADRFWLKDDEEKEKENEKRGSKLGQDNPTLEIEDSKED